MSSFQGLGLQSERAAGISLPVEKQLVRTLLAFGLVLSALIRFRFPQVNFFGRGLGDILALSQALLLVYCRRVCLFVFFNSVVRSLIISGSIPSTSSSAIVGAVATRNL